MNREYVASREYLFLVYKWMRDSDDIVFRGRHRRPAVEVVKFARAWVAAILKR